MDGEYFESILSWWHRASARAGWFKHLQLADGVGVPASNDHCLHQFPGEAGPPKDFEDILVPSAASSASYLFGATLLCSL